MASEKGYRSEAAKRLSDQGEMPEDSSDELDEEFFEDDGSDSATRKKMTNNMSAEDTKGVEGWINILSGIFGGE